MDHEELYDTRAAFVSFVRVLPRETFWRGSMTFKISPGTEELSQVETMFSVS